MTRRLISITNSTRAATASSRGSASAFDAPSAAARAAAGALPPRQLIVNEALQQAIQYGARRMRVPEEERRLALGFDGAHRAQKTFFTIQFGGLARYMKSRLRAASFTVPERVYGNLQSGQMNESYF